MSEDRKLPPPATTVEEYLYDIALGLRQLNATLTRLLMPQPELTLSGSDDLIIELKEPVLGEAPKAPKAKRKGH